MTADEPWRRNEGKFDHPSSGVPDPAPAAPVPLDEVERERYRGVEPLAGSSHLDDGALPASVSEAVEDLAEVVAETIETIAATIEPPAGATPSHRLLQAFVSRVETLDGEIADLQHDRRDVLAEAKSAGFDPKALRELLRRRKIEPRALAEIDALVEVYEEAVRGMARGQVWGGDLTLVPRAIEAPKPTNERGRRAAEAVALIAMSREAREA